KDVLPRSPDGLGRRDHERRDLLSVEGERLSGRIPPGRLELRGGARKRAHRRQQNEPCARLHGRPPPSKVRPRTERESRAPLDSAERPASYSASAAVASDARPALPSATVAPAGRGRSFQRTVQLIASPGACAATAPCASSST